MTIKRWKNTEHWRCPQCRSTRLYKSGFVRGHQRFCCKNCHSVTIAPKGKKK